MAFTLGIDIAKWQGELKFEKVLNAKPVDIHGKVVSNLGVKYVDIKATNGIGVIDPRFIRNAEKSAGVIRRGFYDWFFPHQDPIEQADFFVDTIKPFSLKNDLLAWVDFEQDDPKWRGEPLRERLRTHVDHIEDRTGRPVVIYTGKWFWRLACLDQDDEWAANHFLAHAEYPGNIPGENQHGNLAKPWAIRNILEKFHQFDGNDGLYLPADCSNTGRPVDSDFDRFNGTEEELEEMCNLSTLPITTFDAYKPIEFPSREEILEGLFPKDKDKDVS